MGSNISKGGNEGKLVERENTPSCPVDQNNNSIKGTTVTKKTGTCPNDGNILDKSLNESEEEVNPLTNELNYSNSSSSSNSRLDKRRVMSSIPKVSLSSIN